MWIPLPPWRPSDTCAGCNTGRSGGSHHPVGPGFGADIAQGRGRSTQGGSGGDHVVDHQDPDARWQGPGHETGSVGDPIPTRPPGLGGGSDPAEQGPTGDTQFPGHHAGDRLGLVETPSTTVLGRGGGPRDQVEGAAPGPHPPGQEDPEGPGKGPAVGEFQGGDHPGGRAGVQRPITDFRAA